MLRRVLMGCVLATALMVSPFVALAQELPSFPYHTYAEVPVQNIRYGMCGEENRVAVVSFETEEGVRFTAMSTRERDVIARVENGTVTAVYLTVTEGENIVVKETLTSEEFQRRFPGGPCGYLVPGVGA